MDLVSEAVVSRHGRRVQKGTVIFREGESHKEMYIIQEGLVRLQRRVGSEEVVLAILQAGEFFGEMCLWDSTRSASAIAETDSLVIAIDTDTFLQILSDSPELSRRVIGRLVQRLRANDEQILKLMTRDESTRLAEALYRQLRDRPQDADGLISVAPLDEALLASMAGVLPSNAERFLERLVRLGVLHHGDGARLVCRSLRDLEDFLDYCEMKREVDPLHLEELAKLAGMPLTEAEILADRVIQKRLSGHERKAGQRALKTPFQRYLQLKLRFEFTKAGSVS